jgi:transcriptional regulator with XRE-family HTH domain
VAKEKSEPALIRQLREAISHSGLPLNQLSKASGVHRSALSRFMRGERGLTLDGAAKVCEALGLVLAEPPKRRRPRASDN